MSFYGNVGTPFLGSGLYGSSYLSSKHLKRAMKYGSYHAPVHSISAPAVYGSSYLGGATVIHAPVVQDSFVRVLRGVGSGPGFVLPVDEDRVQETSGMQKVQIKSGILRVMKRYGTSESPPQNVSVESRPNSQIINVLLTF